MEAFALAARMGADGVELDVQRCGTGEVVVLHDESLGRTTGRAALIAETPWSVVRTLDAGSRKSPRFAGARVPLLAEVLAGTGELLLNIELKCDHADDRGLTAEVTRLIADASAGTRVLLSSFNPLCLFRARALAPRIARALLFEEAVAWPLRRAVTAPALGVAALHPQVSLATAAQVARWRRRGYSVAAWTVDDVERAAALWASGVAGIITNRPDRMRARWP